MKRCSFLFLLLFFGYELQAQKTGVGPGTPFVVSVFTESVSLPNLRFGLRRPNLGLRIGTELYYSRRNQHQVYQTIGLGFYHHRGLQTAFFLNTEIGYRRLFGQSFAGISIGGGYLHQRLALPVYRSDGNGQYHKASPARHLLMPVAGIGGGHRLKGGMDVFGRYEVFTEMPFGLNGIPLLPHKALHLGTRIPLQ